MIKAIPVRTDKDLKDFINYPYKLYKSDRYWVPPLKRDVRNLLDKKKNPFWTHAEKELFLVYRDKQLSGRIAAIIDYNFMEFWDEKTAYFGFFECDNDEEAAKMLFDHVQDYFSDKGIDKFIGPMNPSTNDECAVLIEGFYTPPYIMMTHNYEYYDELIKKCGLKKAKDLFAYYLDMKDAPIEYLERICSIVRRRVHDLKVRSVDLDSFNKEVQIVKEIYNDAWSRNWGFVPMTDEEIAVFAQNMKSLIVPELVPIVEIDGEPVAISLAVPNYNAVLSKMNGRLGPIEMLKFLYYKKKIKEARLIIMGVRKQYRKLGLESLLFLESFRAGQQLGYTGGELSWILEDNHATNNAITKMGGKVHKKYRIYEGKI
jgi:hypothetical protein